MHQHIIKDGENDIVQLYNTDCTPFISKMLDNSVDLVVTDPPYGITYRSNRQRVDRKKSIEGEGSFVVRNHYFDKIENDKMQDFSWMKDIYRILKQGCAIYVFCHWSKWADLCRVTEESGFLVKNMIVLNKSNHGMGDLKSWAPKHELILFATKGRHELIFPKGRIDDIWNVPVKFSGSKRFHPNEKPVSWITPIIENSSRVGETVFDPFMGSGTTGIVSLSMNRKFIGCDLDETYYKTSIARIEQAWKQNENLLM